MPADPWTRSLDDLDRTVRAIATEFKTDKIFIIGSQGILLAWPDAPTTMRASPEIDAYPANARIWEDEEKGNTLTKVRRHPNTSMRCSEADPISIDHTASTSMASMR